VDAIFAEGGFKGWGDYDPSYLERRVMEDVTDPHRDPWLWAYAHLVGAHEDADTVRAVLNGIQRSA
jgi:hypothetical protein